MDLHAQLATRLLRDHPDEEARVLEDLDAASAAAVLAEAEPECAGNVLRRIALHARPGILRALTPERLGAIVAELDLDIAAQLLRRLPPETQRVVCGHLSERETRLIGALLRFPEHSAGALMDPDVLSLPVDLSVKEAIARIREHPESVRYNLYVTDAEHRLVGALNLRELLLAQPQVPLRSIMNEATHRVGAHAGRDQIARHPGWQDVHALPVVDERGIYVGTIRYRTLRRIEHELHGRGGEGAATVLALGDLFATGAASLLAAITEIGGREDGDKHGA